MLEAYIMPTKLIQIATAVVPGMAKTSEIVVYALDADGNLWKWDTAQNSDEWIKIVNHPR